jgi:integrase
VVAGFRIGRPSGPPLRKGEPFPLSPHGSGKWQKRIRKEVHYFGQWARRVNGKLERVEGDGWKEALAEYRKVADDLRAGRTPRMVGDGLTVAELGNRFLTAKEEQVKEGELSPLTFAELKDTCQFVADAFGKERLVDDLAADDFGKLRARMAERWGPVRLGNVVGRVRSLFKFAVEERLIDRPVFFGPRFAKPSKKVLRKHRAANGGNMMEAEEIRRLLDATSRPDVRAMFLLSVNCAFGPMDLATLPIASADLDAGVVTHARPKNGNPRRCPLWPESVEAIRAALACRRPPADAVAAGLVFLTPRGRQLLSKHTANPITILITNALRTAGLHKPGRAAYVGRHVFRTVADESPDRPAIDLIMGHSDGTMASAYRERIADARLRAVTDLVREWLFPASPTAGTEGGAS